MPASIDLFDQLDAKDQERLPPPGVDLFDQIDAQYPDQKPQQNTTFGQDLGTALNIGTTVDIPKQAIGTAQAITNSLLFAGSGKPNAASRLVGEYVFDPMRTGLNAREERLRAEFSPAQQTANEQQWLGEDVSPKALTSDGVAQAPKKFATAVTSGKILGPAFNSPETVARKAIIGAAESAPGSFVAMGPTALFARKAGMAAMAEVARKTTDKAVIEKAGELAAGKAAMIIGGLGEGIQGQGDQYESTLKEVRAMNMEVLRKHPEFQKAFAETDPSLSLEQREKQARDSVAHQAATYSAAIAFAFDSVFGAAGDKYIGTASMGKGKRWGSALEGLVQETPTEFIQSGGEQFGTNIGIRQHADLDRSLMQDVGEHAVGGGLSGGIMGVGMGGGLHRGSAAQSTTQTTEGIAGENNLRRNDQAAYLRSLNLPTRELIDLKNNPDRAMTRNGIDPTQIDAVRIGDIDALLDDRYRQMSEARAFQGNGGPLTKAAGQVRLTAADEMDRKSLELDRERTQAQRLADQSMANRLVGQYWQTIEAPPARPAQAPQEEVPGYPSDQEAADFESMALQYLQGKNTAETRAAAAQDEKQAQAEWDAQTKKAEFLNKSRNDPRNAEMDRLMARQQEKPWNDMNTEERLAVAAGTGFKKRASSNLAKKRLEDISPGSREKLTQFMDAMGQGSGQEGEQNGQEADKQPAVARPMLPIEKALAAAPVTQKGIIPVAPQEMSPSKEPGQEDASRGTWLQNDAPGLSPGLAQETATPAMDNRRGLITPSAEFSASEMGLNPEKIPNAVAAQEMSPLNRTRTVAAQEQDTNPVVSTERPVGETPPPDVSKKSEKIPISSGQVQENDMSAEAPAETPAQRPDVQMTSRTNEVKGGIEVQFPGHPGQEVIAKLKGAGFRWSSKQKLWYAKDSPIRQRFVANLQATLAGKEQTPVNAKAASADTQTGPRAILPQKTLNIYDQAMAGRDATKLKEILHADNKNLRALFEKETGRKLDKTVRASESVIDEWAATRPEATPAAAAPPQAETPQASATGYGAENKLVTRERAEELRRKLRAKLNQLNAGIDPEMLALGTELAVYHIEAGARSFANFARTMVTDLGEKVKPYLKAWYMGAKNWPGMDRAGMDSEDTVHSFGVEDLVDKTSKNGDTVKKGGETNELRPGGNVIHEGEQQTGIATHEGRWGAGQVSEGPGNGNAGRGGLDRPANDRGGSAAGLHAEGAKAQPGAVSGQGTVHERPGRVPGELQGAGGRRSAETESGSRSGPVEHLQNAASGENLGVVHKPGRRGERKPGKALQATDVVPGRSDYRITDADNLGKGGPKQKARDNIEAIRVLKTLQAENRPATKEEQAILVKYVGWGASDLANKMFPPKRYVSGQGYVANIDPDWAPLVKELQGLLTTEEIAAAQASTLNAHYTSQAVIESMYKALERFGFKGGKILEPGSGIGSFVGLIPGSILSKTRFTAIEMDPITAGIAKTLYPGHDIRNMDFAKFKAPNGFFDVAIGNPPFSDVPVTQDPDYASQRLSLHDFFFVKALDKVRPGGLMILVTSRYTMDKLNDRARQILARKADLIGAIRLPQTAFKENAGTDVVTDVLFLRKRLPGEAPAGEAWNGVKDIDLPGGAVNINEYYADHPDMVLGTHSLAGKMYSAGQYTVEPKEGDIDSQFDKAVQNLPRDIYSKPKMDTQKQEEVDAATFAPENVKEGAYFLDPDKGAVLTKENGVGVPANIPVSQQAKLKGLVGIRDAVRQVLYVQLAKGSDVELAVAQKQLGKQYDAFVKAFGPINKEIRSSYENKAGKEIEVVKYPNWSVFKKDPDAYLVAGIEHYDSDTDKAEKAAIFTRRVISPVVEPKIESLTDALHVVMHQTGAVDMAKIADLMGVTEEQAADGLGNAVFHDPSSQTWVTDDEYLSGNVKKKLADARSAAEIDKKYARNVTALEAVQPADLPPSRIPLSLGMPIFDPEHIEQFAKEVFGAEITVRHFSQNADWNIEKRSGWMTAATTSDWGTGRYNAIDLLDAALNATTVKAYDTVIEDGKEKKVLNKDATEAANAKLQAIKERFSTWAWEEANRAERLARRYNDAYNNTVKREYGGAHIHSMQFPGISAAKPPMEHQKRVAWRIVQRGNTYMAHSVGAGKTIASIVAGMELKRLGIKKKPMWTVPNHMLKQFSAEFLELYPAAKILVADEEQFSKANRNRFMGKVATENWDGIIITHSAFGKIPMGPEFQTSFIQQQLDEYETLLQSTNDRIRRKQIERAKKRLQARLDKILNAESKDKGVTFEEAGIDQLFVDEAQAFRKLDFVSNQSDIKGIDPNGSVMAADLYAKSQYLESLYPGRSLVMMSGTPITNTIGELYTIQKFLQGPLLEELGLHNFDAWAATFGDMVSDLEQTPGGPYKMVSRFARYKGMPALSGMWAEVGDFVHAKDLTYLSRPQVKEGGRQIIVADQSELQKAYKRALAERIKAIEQRRRPPRKGDDIILSVIMDGRHAAIDDRFINPHTTPGPGGKLDMLVDKVFGIWQKTKADRKTQMIFSDLGLPGAEEQRGFSAYNFIRDELIKRGVPAKEIAFMQDYKKSEDKRKLFRSVKRGEVRVLIGSSQAMGTGVNAQERLVALHHVDPDNYLPAWIEQREGRIIRQGNKNAEVEIYAYLTRGSYDETMWQFLETKQRFIDQFLAGQAAEDQTSDVDGSADKFATAKAMASDNPLILERAGVEHDLQRLESLLRAHADDQRRLAQRKANALALLPILEKSEGKLRAAIGARTDTAGDKFQMTFNGASFADRKEAGAALLKVLAAQTKKDSGWHKVGELAGGDLILQSVTGIMPSVTVGLNIAGESTSTIHFSETGLELADPVGTIMKLENAARSLDGTLRATEAQIARANKDVEDATSRIGKKFEHADALASKRARLQEINAELVRQDAEAGREEGGAPEGAEGSTEVATKRGKGAYRIKGKGNEVEYVSGEPVAIDELPDVSFFVHKTDDGYVVTEETTGLNAISPTKTKLEAIANVKKEVHRLGAEKVKQSIADAPKLNAPKFSREPGGIAWSKDRIAHEVSYAAYDDGRTKASVAWVNPDDFIRATTDEPGVAGKIGEEAGSLDLKRLRKEEQTPYLRMTANGTAILGHEGRHRMAAMARAGYTRVPIVLDYGKGAKREAQGSIEVSGENGNGVRLSLSDVTPLTFDNALPIFEKMRQSGTRFSQGTSQEAPAQSTAAEVKQRRYKSLSIRGLTSLTKAGKLNIVQTEAELFRVIGDQGHIKSDEQGRTLGAYHNGVAYLVADNLTSENTHGVLLHEMVHAELDQNGWQGLLGDNYADIKKQVERLIAEGHTGLLAAQEKAILAGTRSADLFEETISHFVQERANQSTNLFRRILRAINAWAVRVGLRRTISADDLVDLAEASLRRGASGAPQRNNVLYSRTTANRIRREGVSAKTEEEFHASIAGQIQDDMNATPSEAEMNGIIGRAVKAGRPVGLGGLTLRQIADIYGGRIPEVKDFYNASRALGAETNKRMAKADEILTKWRDLPKEQSEAMASIMYEATLHAVNPDSEDFEPRVDVEATRAKIDDNKAEIVNLQKDKLTTGADLDYLSKKLDKLEAANRDALLRIERERERGRVYRRIAREYRNLDDATKQVYQDVRAYYEQNFMDLKEALINRMLRTIKDKTAKKIAMDKIRVMFEKQIKEGPYFPLARFGKFVVIATKGSVQSSLDGGSDRIVSSFESVKEQESTAASLKAQGFEVKMKVKAEGSMELDGPSPGFVSGVVNLINDAAIEASEKADLLDDVNQLLIRTMPDLSHRKHFIHRKKVTGFSRDAIRSFAANTQHAAHHIARINHADKMSAAIESIREKIDRETAGDTTIAGQVNNELVKRLEQINNPNISPVAQALTSAGFLWHIGPSIASATVNLTQTPLVAYPVLAARNGSWTSSADALRKATFDFMRSPWTANGPSLLKSDRISDAEKAMIRQLIDDGTIDVTQAHELAQAASSNFLNAAQTAWGFQVAKAMRLVSYPFHVTEIANRKITALAAYRAALRMARDKGEDATSAQAHEKAIKFARDVVMDSHFDYSQTNRARYMEGWNGYKRVLLLFRQYSQNMWYLMGRSFYNAAKGESAEVKAQAKKQLLGILGGHFLMSGILGMPVIGAVADLVQFLLNGLGDGDDPVDWETSLRNAAADTLGVRGGEMLTKGAVRGLIPWDVSSRVSLSDLIYRKPTKEAEGRDQFTQLLEMAAGPLAGLGSNLAAGAHAMAEGQVWRGAEMMLPKALKDAMKSVRYFREGLKSWDNEQVLAEISAMQTFGQLLGFSPTTVTEMYEGRSAIKNREALLNKRRQRLVNEWVNATRKGNAPRANKILDDIAAFNETNPVFEVKRSTLRKSLRAHQRAESNTKKGVYLPSTKDELRDIGRFVSAVP